MREIGPSSKQEEETKTSLMLLAIEQMGRLSDEIVRRLPYFQEVDEMLGVETQTEKLRYASELLKQGAYLDCIEAACEGLDIESSNPYPTRS